MSNKVVQFIRRCVGKSDASAPDSHGCSQHKISRKDIGGHALTVLSRLKDAGFSAHLVGGGVRDILLQRKPKDYDIATDAHPEQVRKVFRNSRIIGRRFRLVHVYFKDEIIEVSTFRSNVSEDERTQVNEKTGMIRRDNTYGTIEEDAWRRDFTVNALYYSISDTGLTDLTGGLEDLARKQIRVIGDPEQRYHEDPVRMLRAIRLSAKLGFTIEKASEDAVLSLPHLLQHVPASRLFDELQKLFFEGNAQVTYESLQKYNYFAVLFPQTAHVLKHCPTDAHTRLIELAIKATDDRIREGQSINPGFLLAILLWPVLEHELEATKHKNHRFFMRLHQVMDDVLKKQLDVIQIPKRFQVVIQSVWILQFYLKKRRSKRIYHCLNHRYFRAAFDFLCLRKEAGERLSEECDWWLLFQESGKKKQAQMIDALRSKK